MQKCTAEMISDLFTIWKMYLLWAEASFRLKVKFWFVWVSSEEDLVLPSFYQKESLDFQLLVY